MFNPKTEKIKIMAGSHEVVISQMDGIFNGDTRLYIDYANVRSWSTKLGWHIDLKRLKQFLDSFTSIQAVNFYSGYLEGDTQSEKEIKEVENQKYVVRSKPVKIMKFAIDASSVPSDSSALLEPFISRALLRKYNATTIGYLNDKFRDMNKNGELFIEDRKCNFDVEIGLDMLLDYEKNKAETFALWSGDSDFADPLEKLLKVGKKVVLFATARRVSTELSALRDKGMFIFDIQKIRQFICWNREI